MQENVHKRVFVVDDTGGFRFAQRKSKIFRTLLRVLVPAYSQKRTPSKGCSFRGGRSGTRTLGPLIKSQLLYQLS